MKKYLPMLAIALSLGGSSFFLGHADEPKKEPAFPRFRMQEIETGLKVGYAVLLVDINGDGKPDIVVADTNRVVWYENPTWKRRTIISGKTKPDNVCLAAYDIDGDGQIDLALGADWKPFNTKDGGTIQWLKRGKTLDEEWTVYPIGEEPTVHRMRFVTLYHGQVRLIVTPLMGHNASREANWMNGSPVRVLAYQIPKDPTKERWVPEVLDQSMHVVHNFCPDTHGFGKGSDLLTASYEGVSRLRIDPSGSDLKWTRTRIGEGNQSDPKGSMGASEIKTGWVHGSHYFIATIEPWHGNQVVVYNPPSPPDGDLGPPDAKQRPWNRHVIDEQLKWGHAVWCADLDGDGDDEIIIGVRDDLGSEPAKRRGVRIYKALDKTGAKWARHDIDPGGVAVEDLAAADLNGDGKIDIVAVGRQTGNIRIYWNEGTGK